MAAVRRPQPALAFGAVLGSSPSCAFMHALAWLILPPAAELAGRADQRMLAMIGGTLLALRLADAVAGDRKRDPRAFTPAATST